MLTTKPTEDYSFIGATSDKIDYDKVDPIKYKDMFEPPDAFQEAWEHQWQWQRAKWRLAIKLELMKMERMGVWKKVKKSIIPKGRRCVKHKWVFDVK
jgi:hypothetical protein